MNCEDIQENKMFQYLQNYKKCAQMFADAPVKGYVVLVPTTLALTGNKINTEFVTHHVLVLEEERKAVGGDPDGSVARYRTLSGRTVTSKGGFLETGPEFGSTAGRVAGIIFEELCYNDNFDSFRVLCVDNALVGKANAEANMGPKKIATPLERRSLEVHQAFMYKVMGQNLDSGGSVRYFINEFALSAVSQLRKSVKNVNLKVKALIKDLEEAAVVCLRKRTRSTAVPKTALIQIAVAVDTIVMAELYQPVFGGLAKICTDKDQKFKAIARTLQDFMVTDMGLRPEIVCSQGPAIRRMKMLSQGATPVQQLCVLEDVNDLIVEAVKKRLSKAPAEGRGPLAADDLLPLFVFVLLKAEPAKPHACLSYMTHFKPDPALSSKSGRWGQLLAQFEAALEYIMAGKLKPHNEMQHIETNAPNALGTSPPLGGVREDVEGFSASSQSLQAFEPLSVSRSEGPSKQRTFSGISRAVNLFDVTALLDTDKVFSSSLPSHAPTKHDDLTDTADDLFGEFVDGKDSDSDTNSEHETKSASSNLGPAAPVTTAPTYAKRVPRRSLGPAGAVAAATVGAVAGGVGSAASLAGVAVGGAMAAAMKILPPPPWVRAMTESVVGTVVGSAKSSSAMLFPSGGAYTPRLHELPEDHSSTSQTSSLSTTSALSTSSSCTNSLPGSLPSSFASHSQSCPLPDLHSPSQSRERLQALYSSLYVMMQDAKTPGGAPLVCTHDLRGRSYPNTFIGHEAVSWVLQYGLVKSRAEGVELWRGLMKANLVVHVTREEFKDAYSLLFWLDPGAWPSLEPKSPCSSSASSSFPSSASSLSSPSSCSSSIIYSTSPSSAPPLTWAMVVPSCASCWPSSSATSGASSSTSSDASSSSSSSSAPSSALPAFQHGFKNQQVTYPNPPAAQYKIYAPSPGSPLVSRSSEITALRRRYPLPGTDKSASCPAVTPPVPSNITRVNGEAVTDSALLPEDPLGALRHR